MGESRSALRGRGAPSRAHTRLPGLFRNRRHGRGVPPRRNYGKRAALARNPGGSVSYATSHARDRGQAVKALRSALNYPWLGARCFHGSRVHAPPATAPGAREEERENHDVIRAPVTRAPGRLPAVEPLLRKTWETCPFFPAGRARVLATKKAATTDPLTTRRAVILTNACQVCVECQFI